MITSWFSLALWRTFRKKETSMSVKVRNVHSSMFTKRFVMIPLDRNSRIIKLCFGDHVFYTISTPWNCTLHFVLKTSTIMTFVKVFLRNFNLACVVMTGKRFSSLDSETTTYSERKRILMSVSTVSEFLISLIPVLFDQPHPLWQMVSYLLGARLYLH
jgi:hypothetical protein